ncbi:MAG: L-aspartate oxidase [Pseudomonadota bacterium]
MNETLIVGAGVAGLFTALKAAPRPVTVLSARRLGRGGSSVWAQGGIAAAVGADDTADLHLEDTLAAGAGLVDTEAARILTNEGPARIADLEAYGARFDKTPEGAFLLGREAAHGRNRIIHASGDEAGAQIMRGLVESARKAPHIKIRERIVVEDLLRDDNGRVAGVLAFDVDGEERLKLPASETILATGGLGGLYAVTTNPVRAQGHGLAFAARAGAVIRDPEFVQFHPTALDVDADPAPLATEALRGVGVRLVNGNGDPFMHRYHQDGDLAPRDVVARAVEAERSASRGAFLDAREALGERFEEAFPTVFSACSNAGLNPATDLLPVAPAAHYHMGGVMTDLYGRSSVDGLWAIGEVASTGVHGANRLASNSLLEAIVFGARAALALRDGQSPPLRPCAAPEDRLETIPAPIPHDTAKILRKEMAQGAALRRSAESLIRAQETIAKASASHDRTSGLLSATTAANLIIAGALKRQESRGAHTRLDYPEQATPAHTLVQLAEEQGAPETSTQLLRAG